MFLLCSVLTYHKSCLYSLFENSWECHSELTLGLAEGVPGGPPPPGMVTAALTAVTKYVYYYRHKHIYISK